LFAWEALESFGYYDLDLVKKSESLGKPVHVIESSKQTMDIKVIPSAP
jgi:glycine cleavage system H lipoate-binding protein